MWGAFGLHRLGHISSRHPRVILLLIGLATIVFALGLMRISYSSKLHDVFRTNSPEYSVLEEMTQTFSNSDSDIFVVIEGESLLSAENLETLRNLHFDLLLLDDAQKVLSIFLARAPPDADGNRVTLVPDEITADTDLDELKRQLLDHPLVSGKFLSPDANLTILAVSLADPDLGFSETRNVIEEIREYAESALEHRNATVRLTGLPVVRIEIIDILTHDQLVFKLAAYAITLVLSWLFFASLRYLALAILPPVIATIWLLGGMGWAGQDISVVTNVVPSLVMVISFANAIHLLLGIRLARRNGLNTSASIYEAVTKVGPATILTSLTTAIALLSLTLVDQPVITRFALTAAYGVGLTFFIVLTIVPALSTLILKDNSHGLTESRFSRLVAKLSKACSGLVIEWPRAIVSIGAIVFLACSILYFLNSPHFRFRANLPRSSEAFVAMQIIEEKLAGISSLRIFVRWPDDHSMISQQTLEVIGKVHDILLEEPLVRDVWSLAGVARWIEQGHWTRDDSIDFFREHTANLSQRLLSEEGHAALITGQIPDSDAPDLLAASENLKQKLSELASEYPNVSFDVTGIAIQSARSATAMIWQLSRSLLVAIAVIIVLIGFALRSVWAAVLSILPNLLPIAAAGSYLYLSGQQLQFTSIIVFTVGFGIAVDSTIHMLNYYFRQAPDDAENQARNEYPALQRTITVIGPALIISTLALMAGGVTMLSPLPMAQLYGQLIVLVLAVALIGDILLLPALILVSRLKQRGGA